MTKKDYELIAGGFREATASINSSQLSSEHKTVAIAGISQSAHVLARMLKQDNIKFLETRFIRECGFEF